VVAAVDQGLVSGSETLVVSLDEGDEYDLGDESSASVTIVNDDPVLAANGGPIATPLIDTTTPMNLALTDPSASSNQGTLVSALLGSGAGGNPVSESDGDAVGIAITAVDSAYGNWQFSLDGTHWTALAPTGDSAAELLPADSSTRVRFLANPGYRGTLPTAITFKA